MRLLVVASCLAVPLTRCLARGAEHGADGCPGVSFGTRAGDRLGEVGFGLGPRSDRGPHSPQRCGVVNLAGVGVVALKPVGELVGLVDDLLEAAGHQLRYWRRAGMARIGLLNACRIVSSSTPCLCALGVINGVAVVPSYLVISRSAVASGFERPPRSWRPHRTHHDGARIRGATARGYAALRSSSR